MTESAHYHKDRWLAFARRCCTLVTDQRGRLLMATLGFATCSMPSYDRALWALRTWLDSWSALGRVAVGMHRQGYDLQLTRRSRVARDVLHNRDGALSYQCDGHRLGAHTVARDAEGGMEALKKAESAG